LRKFAHLSVKVRYQSIYLITPSLLAQCAKESMPTEA
jgi:hypothetical protein